MSKEKILKNSAIKNVNYKDNGDVDYLEVNPSGNLRVFTKIVESDELYLGNVSTINGNLKVNIRADKS